MILDKQVHTPYVGDPRARRAGGIGDLKPILKRLALVSSRWASEIVAETAVARVARTAKTVVNFMINNEGRIGRIGSKEGGKIISF